MKTNEHLILLEKMQPFFGMKLIDLKFIEKDKKLFLDLYFDDGLEERILELALNKKEMKKTWQI